MAQREWEVVCVCVGGGVGLLGGDVKVVVGGVQGCGLQEEWWAGKRGPEWEAW